MVQRTINEDRELRKMDEFCTESLPVLGVQVAVKDLTKGKSGPLITYRIKSGSTKEDAFETFDRHFESLNWERSGVAELPLTSIADYSNGEYKVALNHGYFGLDANFAIDCRLLRTNTK